jgi:hypothetical protein
MKLKSRRPQKHSTDIQLFIIHNDYDIDSSEEEKEASTTSTSATTVATVASTTDISCIPITIVTSVVTTSVNNAAVIPQHIHHAYHANPVVNDRLRAATGL